MISFVPTSIGDVRRRKRFQSFVFVRERVRIDIAADTYLLDCHAQYL